MALSKDQILGIEDRPTKTVHVPEWGGDVILRTMSGAERSGYEESNRKRQGDEYVLDLKNLHAKLLSRCLVDDNGERLFTTNEITALNEKSASVLARLFDIAAKMNGLRDEDVEEAGKDSEEATGSSTSD